jgi:hypothetical protein
VKDPLVSPTWVIEEFDGTDWKEVCLFVGSFAKGFKVMKRSHAGKNVRFKPVDKPYPIGYAAHSNNQEVVK